MKEIKIISVQFMGGHKLKIKFHDDTEQIVDFGPFLKASSHPEISKYLDEVLFKDFHLENDDLMWGDYDLMFPIYDLYTNSISKGSKKNSQEAS